MKHYNVPADAVMDLSREHGHVDVLICENASEHNQLEVLLRALQIYSERNVRYKDNWRRFGWRGCLFRVRERAERAWDDLWDAVTPKIAHEQGASLSAGNADFADTHVDDLIDLINLAAFAVRAIRENNRDGTGAWW